MQWEKRRFVASAAVIAMMAGSAAAVAATAAAAADGDGVNGEVRGYLWPGGNGTPNWEGTYRMPDGSEAWCASVWSPEPIWADDYGQPVPLTLNDGSPISASDMQTLAYVVSTASDAVINRQGKEADDHAAAASVLIHSLTNAVPADYDPEWPLIAFDANEDPLGTGQQTTDVRAVYDSLLADATQFGGEWEIEFGPAPDGVIVGDAVELAGELRTAAGVGLPDRQVQVNGTGIDLDSEEVTTDSEGRFVVSGTVTEQSTSIEASRIAPAKTVMMREPTTWTSSERPQNMILVEDNRVRSHTDFTSALPVSPEIGTSAHDQKDGDRLLPWDGGTIVDVVSYRNLTPGVEYTIAGELMDKATRKGTGIAGTATFTPSEADGTVEVRFTVPVGFADMVLVVFERLYDVNGELVASHEDFDAIEQTITVEPSDEVPPGPTPTPTPSAPTPTPSTPTPTQPGVDPTPPVPGAPPANSPGSGHLPATGPDQGLLMAGVVGGALLAGLGATLLVLRRRQIRN